MSGRFSFIDEAKRVQEITIDTDNDLDSVADYSKLKVPQLKILCKKKGLSTSGRKADLVAKLEQQREIKSKNEEEETQSPPRKRRKLENKTNAESDQENQENESKTNTEETPEEIYEFPEIIKPNGKNKIQL